MSLDFILLFLLTFAGGLFYAWLGAGAGALLVPFLPYVSSLSALGAVQASLLMGALISLINSLVFLFQKLILWSWILKSLFFIITASFLAGFCLGFLSSFQIRLILWSFFLFILFFPSLLSHSKLKIQDSSKAEPKKSKLSLFGLEAYKMRFFYLCSILAGFSSGLTGVGGGLILSPFFHESRLIPSKNIPAVMSVLFLCVTSFSLLGQIAQNTISLEPSSEILSVCLQILPGYFLGSVAGYIVNSRQNKPQLRRRIIRFLVLLLFLKMTLEIFPI